MVSLNLKVGKVRAVVTVPAGARVADIRRAAEPFLVGDEWAQVRSGTRQCRVIHAGKSLSRNAAPLEDEGVRDGAQIMVAGMEPVAAGAAVTDVPAPQAQAPPPADASAAAVEDVVDEDDEEAMLQAALKASVEECAGEGEDVRRSKSEPMEVDGGSDDELAAALRMSAEAAGDGVEGEDDDDEETREALRLSMEEAEKEEAEKKKKQEEQEKEKEEEYEEIEFERFDSSNVHVAEDTMEELKKYYSEDNRYVCAKETKIK